MTAVDNITSLRQRREEIVKQHVEAENRHNIEATIATFYHPHYEVNGVPIAEVRFISEGCFQDMKLP